MINAKGLEPYLKLHRGEEVRLKGETFSDWEALKEFAEESSDTKMTTMIAPSKHSETCLTLSRQSVMS